MRVRVDEAGENRNVAEINDLGGIAGVALNRLDSFAAD
jgi:hypothetical protein